MFFHDECDHEHEFCDGVVPLDDDDWFDWDDDWFDWVDMEHDLDDTDDHDA